MKSEDDRQAAKGTGRRRLKVAGEVLIFLFYLLVLDQVIYRLPVEPPGSSQNPYLAKEKLYAALEAAPDVLYMGSSRIWTGLIPSRISQRLAAEDIDVEGFNFGASATTPVVHWAFLRDRVLPRWRPRLIILEVAAREFNANNGRNEKPFTYLTKKGDVIPFLLAGPTAVEAKALVFSNIFMSSRRFSDVRAWIQGKTDPEPEPGGTEPVTIQHPDGWLEYAWTPPVSWGDKKAYWRRVYREEVLVDYEIRGAPDLAFRRFLELAAENGIPVKLLNMPVTAEQMEFFTRGEYDAYIDYITRTADDFGVEFIDYNTPEKRAPLEWYHDTHHLNTRGAEGFSDIVADDVVGPFFAGANPS